MGIGLNVLAGILAFMCVELFVRHVKGEHGHSHGGHGHSHAKAAKVVEEEKEEEKAEEKKSDDEKVMTLTCESTGVVYWAKVLRTLQCSASLRMRTSM